MKQAAIETVDRIVAWYVANVYGRLEGPGCTPFFADAARVGFFAVDLQALRARDAEALFKLLILFSFFQSRRDVDMMKRQATMPRQAVRELSARKTLSVLVADSRCELLRDSKSFDAGCDVHRSFEQGTASCATRPRTPCHVKRATLTIGRMHDMGKIPTSAWLHLGPAGIGGLFKRECAAEHEPSRRARSLVVQLTAIHRIGPKLASMYVSALSVDELNPGFAPWSPEVDGREIVVVDTNVQRVLDRLAPSSATGYQARAARLIDLAAEIDLRRHHRHLPAYSPRFVQQALYAFRSRSNRVQHDDPCSIGSCTGCPSETCPFAGQGPDYCRGATS